MKTDALNKEIKEGSIYGFSVKSSGFTQVNIVKVIDCLKYNEEYVKVKILKKFRSSGSNELKEIKIKRTIINVSPNILFPVKEENYNE